VIARVDGRGADAGDVGSRARLGQPDGGDQLACHEAGKQAFLLFGSGQVGQVRQADVVVDGKTQSDSAAVRVHERLDQDLVVAEVAGPDAAESFVGREAEQPDRAGLREHLARDDAVGLPVGDMGCDFLVGEIAGQFGECAVVSVVVHPLHGRSVGMCAGLVRTCVPLSRQDHRRQRSTV
jgi:hypothetical protein